MSERVKCKSCGRLIDADLRFCVYCGAVNRTAFRQDPNKTYCVFCGSEIPGGKVVCPICGTNVVSGHFEETEEDEDRLSPEEISAIVEETGDAARILAGTRAAAKAEEALPVDETADLAGDIPQPAAEIREQNMKAAKAASEKPETVAEAAEINVAGAVKMPEDLPETAAEINAAGAVKTPAE